MAVCCFALGGQSGWSGVKAGCGLRAAGCLQGDGGRAVVGRRSRLSSWRVYATSRAQLLDHGALVIALDARKLNCV
jgi:hypothetical protein